MAVYLEIDKFFEDDACVRYRYARTDGCGGELVFDKSTGVSTCEKPMDGDDEGVNFGRANRKVQLAWKEGHLPLRLIWAS